MLTTMISVVALAVGPNGTTPHWLQDLFASPMAKKAASAQATDKAKGSGQSSPAGTHPPTGAAPGSGGGGMTRVNVGNDPALLAAFKAADAARRLAGGLLDECRCDDAYRAIGDFRREWPDATFMCDDTAADCAIMTGRYPEAYGLLLPWARSQGMGSPQYLLAISLASAELGQVYAGQAEFCRDQVAEGLSQESVSDALDRGLAVGTDAKTVAVLSCLGLGLKFRSSPYLEMALRLDPQNVIAADQLVFRYGFRGRVADIRRIAAGMLKNLPAGDTRRAKFEKTLAESK